MISEEKILEYLAKKAQKKAMRAAKKIKTATVSGYLNESNPFGDANLNEKFVWKKNKKRDVLTRGVSWEERMAEIEKVKRRRDERAAEKAQREEEMMFLQREQAKAEADDFLKKELEFDFHQSKLRSKIRVREGRMKPIDVLATYLHNEPDIELDGPHYYTVFKGLTVKEIEELREDIKLYLNLDRQTPTHTAYWEAMLVVCEWELGEARSKDVMDRTGFRAERGLHLNIETDVRNFLEGMSHDDLVELQSTIEAGMRSGQAKVVEFWEAVLNGLPLYKAKACLKEIHHAKMLRTHLNRLEHKSVDADSSQSDKDKITEDEIEHEIEEPRTFSPKAITDEETDEKAIDPDFDMLLLEKHRLALLKRKQKRMDEMMMTTLKPENSFETRATSALLDPSAEVALDSPVVWWHDRYRPRKPKYFNRVHTGYEWNKYNRTHYDYDNPPPKVVQGYKFDIFYPDLVDKQLAPTYVIEKDGDSSETCIIRFHAGPPYEDIAFRIVNKEWEYSRKKGYKCTFERGTLHLYFNFMRYRYCR
ncbi:splicing factor Cactin-like [Silene latifolia]|uniref:splicing factor Cactin-like n=1 Tax=Silene latifolia TaxID=37657 RepID=UPI003D77016A